MGKWSEDDDFQDKEPYTGCCCCRATTLQWCTAFRHPLLNDNHDINIKIQRLPKHDYPGDVYDGPIASIGHENVICWFRCTHALREMLFGRSNVAHARIDLLDHHGYPVNPDVSGRTETNVINGYGSCRVSLLPLLRAQQATYRFILQLSMFVTDDNGPDIVIIKRSPHFALREDDDCMH
jgi:hypothetical protein